MHDVCLMSVAMCKIRIGWVGGVGLVIHRASELGHNGIKNTDGIIQSGVCGAYTGKI